MRKVTRIQGDTIHIQSVSGDTPLQVKSVASGGGGGYVRRYTGDYTVTPLAASDVVLPTANKLMTDDVTVLKIPYFETANESGNTVYIGEH